MTGDPKLLMSSIFAALVVGLFVLDLAFAARARSRDRRSFTGLMSGLWIAGAAGFTLAVHFGLGHARMLEFVTGYLIEYALSLDNLFVFLTIFSYFEVPRAQQHKVLFWGISSAVVLRLLCCNGSFGSTTSLARCSCRRRFSRVVAATTGS